MSHARTPARFRGAALALLACLVLGVLMLSGAGKAVRPAGLSQPREPETAYLVYVRNAPEFRPVAPPAGPGRWDSWLYMPWRYRWTIGTIAAGDGGLRFCAEHGVRGGVLDRGNRHMNSLDWLDRGKLRFYVDHTAGKGSLFLMPGEVDRAPQDAAAVRTRPLGPDLLRDLSEKIVANVRAVRQSPYRVAYALDDEISAGSLARPIAWRLDADDAAYARWLRGYYGGHPPPARFVGPDEVRGELAGRLADVDLSPLLDRMTYQDSAWANLVGRLVEVCHQEDPSTPCGFVGGQGPSLWGGYDWAKLAKKVQFVEAYDIGSSQALLRSLLPNAPRVTTHFHDDRLGVANDTWLAWHYFAHGNRGMIGWVDGWFDAQGRPRPWLERFGRTLAELSDVQGPKLAGARWLDDGVALYYSHPSVQVSWLLDAEPHGSTWARRNGDDRLGTSHNVRLAWERLLADAGLRYDFLAYDEVVRDGVPARYRVLILPATYALSDIEARRISDFAARGGTVIADFACGLFDQHGRGRSRGALDDLFGVRHDGAETRRDFFGGRLWVESDQEQGYGFRRYRDLLATAEPALHDGYAVAERRLAVATSRRAGRGRAVYLNLSPQRYLMEREEGTATAERRRPFLAPVLAAGAVPWAAARIAGTTHTTHTTQIPLEIAAWSKAGRTLVLVLQNAAISGSPHGGAEGLVEARVPLEVTLAGRVSGAVDERSGRPLPDGDRFHFQLDTTEAAFFSFSGPPPRTLDRSIQPTAPGGAS
jgi:hypothetical protein